MKKLFAALILLLLIVPSAIFAAGGNRTGGGRPTGTTDHAGIAARAATIATVVHNRERKRIPVCNRIMNAKDYQVTAVRTALIAPKTPDGLSHEHHGHKTIEITSNDCLPSVGNEAGENPWTFFVNGQEVPNPQVAMKTVSDVSVYVNEVQSSYQIINVDGTFVLQFMGSFTKK